MNLQPTMFFPAGQVIYKVGEEPIGVYLICSGKVQIFLGDDDHKLLLATLGEKQTFGEMALIAGRKRGATAIALEPTWCFMHNSYGFEEKLRSLSTDLRPIFDNLIELIKNKNQITVFDTGIKASSYAPGKKRPAELRPWINKFDMLNDEDLNKKIKKLDIFMRAILFSLIEIAYS